MSGFSVSPPPKGQLSVAVYDTKAYDRQFLQAAGPEMSWRFLDERLSAANVATANGADAVCVFVNDEVDEACLKGLAGLGVQLVALRCAGFNQVNLDAARELGIAVVRVPAYSPTAIAEHTIALLLTLNRKIHLAHRRVSGHDFSLAGLVGFNLSGKRVGVIGTGKIGRLAAAIFQGFGMEVVACDPYPQQEWAAERGIAYLPLSELLAGSDVISLHLPLAADSRHLLNARTLAQTKRGAVIVNTSRGGLIDSQALLEALRSGQIGGAALDVYEHEAGLFFENLSDQPLNDDVLSLLLDHPNVLITAHQAFLTQEALEEIARTTVDNLRALHSQGQWVAGTCL